MGLFKDYVSQTRKPEGFLGKMMLRGMNSGHAKMADWGLGHLQNAAPDRIVDLGCGGGLRDDLFLAGPLTVFFTGCEGFEAGRNFYDLQ